MIKCNSLTCESYFYGDKRNNHITYFQKTQSMFNIHLMIFHYIMKLISLQEKTDFQKCVHNIIAC